MPEKYAYKTGARKYPSRTRPDSSDAFSQDAANNKPPANGRPDKKDDPKKKRREIPEKGEGSPERDHIDPPPRDTGEAPTPNPNGSQRNKKPAS